MFNFEVFDLGIIGYLQAWEFQRKTYQRVSAGGCPSALIVCQHYPVITLGRQAQEGNILLTRRELDEKGIQVFQAERGGDVTYHGLGQLTVYPIFDLHCLKKDIHWFLRQLEEVVITMLGELGVKAQRIAGLTGVWIKNKKIASIGISVKNWVTFHGVSINVKKDDVPGFSYIRPCGMDIKMISLEEILGISPRIREIKDTLIVNFRDTLSAKAKGVPYRDTLPISLKSVPG